MRAIFSDPNSDGEPVSNLETAAKRAGFTPRMLKSPSVTQFGVIDSFTRDVTLNVSDLTDALREAKATDITVPSAWNGLVLKLHQDAGVLTDYGDFFIIQAPPLTLSGPSGFPMDQFMEVLFRIVGINSTDAHTLRIRPERGYLANSSQWMFRSLRRPLAEGETVRFEDASIEVLSRSEDLRPAEVAVRFRAPLEHGSLRFLRWGTRGYVPFLLPHVGESVMIPAVDTMDALFGGS